MLNRFIVLSFVLFAVSAHASILMLANGDRLTGTVLKRENGNVYFHTDVLGDIVAPEKAVTIVEPPPSATPVGSLAGLPPPPGENAQTVTKPAQPASAARLAQAKSMQPPVMPWTGKLEFGYDNQLTNIRTVATYFRGELDRTIGADDLMLKDRYVYNKSAGLPTADEQDGEFRLRHNLDSRVFLQSDTTGETDRLQQLNFEGQENLGLGYKLVSTVRQTIDVGGGVSAQYLNAEGIQEGWDYLGNVFQDYSYKINGRYTLSEDASAQYSPDRRGQYGLVAQPLTPVETGTAENYAYKFHTTLQGKITRHLSLNLHFDYEYNNVVLDPAARGEQRITTTVGYGF